jgi:hypothetical protein
MQETADIRDRHLGAGVHLLGADHAAAPIRWYYNYIANEEYKFTILLSHIYLARWEETDSNAEEHQDERT